MDVVQGGVEHGGGGYTGYVTMQIANYVIKLITSPRLLDAACHEDIIGYRGWTLHSALERELFLLNDCVINYIYGINEGKWFNRGVGVVL